MKIKRVLIAICDYVPVLKFYSQVKVKWDIFEKFYSLSSVVFSGYALKTFLDITSSFGVSIHD